MAMADNQQYNKRGRGIIKIPLVLSYNYKIDFKKKIFYNMTMK